MTHTFSVSYINRVSLKFPKGSVPSRLLHLLGEVELVFGFWAFIFLICFASLFGMPKTAEFLNDIDFAEVVFVFVIMSMSATQPIMFFANLCIQKVSFFFSKLFRIPHKISLFSSIYLLGTVSGSFITEPVAMTISALLLKKHFFDKTSNLKFKHALLALLFVNVSIGGVLTHFAAPPVLLVAHAWQWDTAFMIQTFGWRAIIAISASTALVLVLFRKEILELQKKEDNQRALQETKTTPYWVVITNILFLLFCVLYHQYIVFLIPIFLLFTGWFEVTKDYQHTLKIRESLLVGFFLGGIVILGSLQGWWLTPLVSQLSHTTLFFGATALTAVTDNAALTYLGTLIPNLGPEFKYSLVAGAVTGGGLTVIANAPNPIGYGILNRSFGESGIRPLSLFLWALPFTIITIICFMI